MEDEEGYMVLSPRMSSKTLSRDLQSTRRQGVSKQFTRYKISTGILGALCTILGSAVLLLLTLVLQSGFCQRETAVAINATKGTAGRLEGSPCLSQHIAMQLCEPFTEHATCRLCPANWTERGGKCFWFSKGKRSWLMAHQDCSRKKGRLAVIHDAEEMGFIHQNTQEKYPVWIGLSFTPSVGIWTWVDGTTLQQDLFPPSHPGGETSCAIFKSNQVRAEMCTAAFNWICEKEALMF